MKKVRQMLLFILAWMLFANCAGGPLQPGGTHQDATPGQEIRPGTSATPLPPPQAIDRGILGKGSPRDVAWSPDGTLLAVVSTTGVYFYDTKSWTVTKTIPSGSIPNDKYGDREVSALAFAPDGKSLLLTASGWPMSFWHYDIQSGELNPWLASIVVDPQGGVLISPDGAAFAFINRICREPASGTQTCSVGLEVRSTADGRLLCRLQDSAADPETKIESYAFSPDGKSIAVGTSDHRIRLWKVSTGKLLHEMQHDSAVADLSFSPDGQVLASASRDATVHFWDVRTGESLFVLRGFKQGIQAVAYLDDGKKLLIGKLYDNVFQEYALNGDYLPSEALGVSMDAGKDLSDYIPADVARTVEASVVSPDTRAMAVLLNANVQIWDLQTGKIILTLPGYNSEIRAVEFSPEGKFLAVADHNVTIWQVSTAQLRATLPLVAYKIEDLALSPDADRVAVAPEGGDVEVWDAAAGQMLRKISPDADGCYAALVAYSPDGSKLATAGGNCIRIWEAATGRLLLRLNADSGDSNGLAFSTDGGQLIYVSTRAIWRWDLTNGRVLYSTKFTGDNHYWRVGASRDLLVLGEGLDGPFHFYNSLTGQPLYDFVEGRGGDTVALSMDGRLFARSDYYNIMLLDSASGAPLLTIKTILPYFIQFSPDNRLLASSSYDEAVHLWDVSSVIAYSAARPAATTTPMPTIALTPTETMPTISPVPIELLTPPAPALNTIRVGNIAQLEPRGKLGLGQAGVAAWSSDGKRLAIGSRPGVYIFDTATSKPIQFLPADNFVTLLAFNPDGSLLAGQLSNMAIQAWDVSTGRALYKLDDAGCWNGDLSFSADGQTLSADCGNAIYRWNVATGALLSKVVEQDYAADLSPDHSLILQVGMADARLLAADTGTIIKTFDVPGMAPALGMFSPDGKTLLVWFYKFDVARTGVYVPAQDPKSLIQLWNIAPGPILTLRTTLPAGKWYPEFIVMLGAFQGLKFTPDSGRLISASGDGQVQIWDTRSGRLLATLPDGRNIYLSPDGRHLLVLGKTVTAWDITAGSKPSRIRTIPGFGGYASFLEFTQDGKQLISASTFNGTFESWTRSGEAFASDPTVIDATGVIQTSGMISHMLWASPDGKRLAYSTLDDLRLGNNDSQNPDWRTLEEFPDVPYKEGARALAFSPDSSQLAVADPDGKVLLWKLAMPQPAPMQLIDSELFVDNLLFTPDGKTLLASAGSSNETTLYLWDTETSRLLRTWKTTGNLDLLVFHPNGATLAAADYGSGTIRLFDLRTWNLLREIAGPLYIRDLSFNPDGSLLAGAYDSKIEFWDSDTGQLLRTLDGSFSRIAFSPDGMLFAAGLGNGGILYWSLPEK